MRRGKKTGMHRRTNPKKMRRRLKAGEANLADLEIENLSHRQTRKMYYLAQSILDAVDPKKALKNNNLYTKNGPV